MKKIKFFATFLLLIVATISVAQPVNGTTTFFTSTTTALQANTTCSITKSVTLSGWLLTIASTSNCGMNWTNSTGGDGRYQNLVGFGTLTQITFGSDDGSEFAMDNMIWGVSTSSWTSKPMRFVGYRNGSPVSGATLNATTPSGTGILNTLVVTFTSNSAFNNVDEIRLAPNSSTCNSILFFEEITIGTASASCTTPTVSTVGSSNVLCNGGSTGSATMSVVGGSGFTYTWSPSGGNSASATGLSAGIYTLSTTNSCGSTGSRTVQITQPASALVTSTVVSNALCNGGAGSATISPAGGTSPYTYLWSTGATASVIANLAGAYTATVTDANNCTTTRGATITEPSALVTSTAVTNALCNGANGSATVTASGGTGAYSYTWSSGPTTSVEPTLLAGTYTVSITDANACNSTKSVTIGQPLALSTTTAMTPPLCNGNNGSATVTASGGTGAYSYTWSSGPTVAVEPTLLAGTYTVKVTDANLCTSTKSVTVTQPMAIGTSTGYTNVFCNGNATGSASIAASGGTSPYTYTWSTASTASVSTGLAAGSYTVRVIDANNCSSTTRTITISQPSALSTSTAVTHALCNGAQGSATLTVTGGTGAYSYTWSSGPTFSVEPTLFAGTYTVKATDANNCSITSSVLVTQPPAIAVATTVAHPLCNGGTGGATVTLTGGTGAYTYTWSTGATNSVVASLSAGTYTVRGGDANNCTSSTRSVIVIAPAAITINTLVTNAPCNGGTGSATLTASGGTGAYSYLWSTAATTSVISGMPPGAYTATVTDANSCTGTKSVTITQPGMLAINASTSHSLICNGNSATLTASGGNTYTWNPGSLTGTSVTVSPTTTTDYTVTGTSVAGCTNTAITTVTVSSCTPAAALNFDGANDRVSLGSFGISGAAARTVEFWMKANNLGVFQNPFSSGTANQDQTFNIKVTPTGHLGFMGFNNDNYPSSGTLIADGNYHHVAVSYDGTNVKGYIDGTLEWTYATTLATVGSNNFIGTSNHAGNEQYFNGSIDELRVWNTARNQCEIRTYKNCEIPTTSTGLVANYHFNQGFSASPNPTVTSLTDASGSGNTGTLTNFGLTSATSNWIIPGGVVSGSITPLPLISSTSSQTNILCNGGSTGAATITASGGTGAYTYLWSSAATTSVVSGLTAGVYTGTVTDANTCKSVQTVTITQPSALVTSTAVTNVLCNGGTGSATITASGGTGAYTYLWSTAATTSVVSGMLAGVYTATVTDANSCTSTKTITITQPSALVTSTAVTNVLCNGGTGSTTITASGGTSGYTYLWSTGATTSVTALLAGAYTATVTDANSCTSTKSVIITQPSALVTSTTVTSVLCNGGSTGSATITASGGTGAYTYLWSTAATTSVVSGMLAGAYTATVTDANSCTSTKSVIITQPSALVTSTAVTSVLCNGGSTGSATITASGGTGAYTYLWSTAATTSVVSGMLAGVYTATVTDANSCTSTKTITITQPSALVTSTAVANVLCNGGTGSATITASGGTSGYTYLWSTGATTSVTALLAGAYTATVTDANSCASTKSVTITQPSALVTSTAVTSVLCNGGSTGSATITASGGTGAYTYLWSTAATTSVVSGMLAGAYTATVTDANSCTSTKSVIITQPSALVTSTAVTSVLCNGGSTGSATITASGGTGAYTYLWSTAATTSVVSGMLAGVYTATVTDANSCTSIKNVTITQPSALVTSTAVANVLCNGGSTGSATITASGGTSGYTYLWSTGATTSVTALLAGAYTATVTDANSCTSTKSVTITQPSALVTSTAVANVLCNGGTGSATITASGGTSGYTYLWSSGATTSVTALLAGAYTATVTDANSCTSTKSVTITQPSALVTSTAVTNVLCNGGTGSATITASGGTSGYTYLWSSGATTSVTALLAGAYTATVTDANSCTSIKSITITEPTALVTSTAVANVLCNGGTGSATITASGGTSGYTYLWSTGATTSVTALLAGSYTATVTDANSCTSTKSITITEPTALVTSTAVANVLCNGGTGSATITASGGTSGYTYLWSTGATTSVTALLAGAYTATVTDANSCTSIKSITITEPTALVTSTAVTSVLCNGGSTGSATITASGGTGSYTYLWSSAATTSVVSGLTAGVYTVTVTDANLCTSTKSVTITEPSALVTSTAVTNVLCNGGTGSATITASGGTIGYTYLWSTAATTSVVSGMLAGVYTATVTDANLCTSIKSVTITEPTALVTSTTVANVLCNGGTGSATITASGGTSGYTYLWSTGATTSVTALLAGAYTATVTDANACTSINSVTITEPSALVTSTAVTSVLCNGGSTGSATITASGGTGSYTYLWSSAATTSVVSGMPAGVYTTTVTDANACTSVNSVTITEPSALVTSTAVTSVLCNGGSTGSATITASGGTGAYTYLWSSAATTSVVSGMLAGVYTATVTDANFCTSIKSVTITEPTVLVASTSASSILCNGGISSVTVSATGGTPAYTGIGTYTAMAGTSSYTVTDGNGCTATTSITISQPAAIASSQTVTLCSGQSVVVGPNTYSVAGIYTDVLSAANSCDSTVTTNLIVNPLPTITVNSGAICFGQSFTMTPSGAITYTYSGGSAVVSPTANATYSVIGTDGNGCVSSVSAISSVTVNTLPVITVNSGAICAGQSFTMIPSGAVTYTYSSGTDVVTPTADATYSVTGTDVNGCVSPISAVSSVTVNALPVITVNSGTICAGQSFTMIPSGAITYTYSSGTDVVTPTADATYSVTGTDGNGCVSPVSAVSSVTVHVLPVITVNSGAICLGQSFTITPSGASTYTYSGGSAVVSPTTNSTYSVTGTDVNGCLSPLAGVSSVTVNTLPVITVNSGVICYGQSFTMTPSGASTYTYSGGSAVVSPTTNSTYSVTGTDGDGCVSPVSAVSSVTVNALPVLSIVTTNTSICEGGTFTLTASGATTYTWNTNSNNASITESPVLTTNYTVNGTNGLGCSNSATITIVVYANPIINIGGDVEINIGDSYQFNPTQTGAVSYTWSPASDLNDPSILNPTTSTQSDITYTLMVTSINGCKASDDVHVTVLNELVIANYMSPNGDGVNDTWKISIPAIIKDYSVLIVDSYNKTVFTKDNNYNNEFDGKLGGQDLPDGSYYYFIKEGNTVKYKGSITITK